MKFIGSDHVKFGDDIKKATVIAGDKVKVEIREAVRLESHYKQPSKKWQKISGETYIIKNGKKTKLKYIGMRLMDEEKNLKLRGCLKMKVKYLGKNEGISLTQNKIYESLGFESGFIRIMDDTDEDYLYDPDNFEIVEE